MANCSLCLFFVVVFISCGIQLSPVLFDILSTWYPAATAGLHATASPQQDIPPPSRPPPSDEVKQLRQRDHDTHDTELPTREEAAAFVRDHIDTFNPPLCLLQRMQRTGVIEEDLLRVMADQSCGTSSNTAKGSPDVNSLPAKFPLDRIYQHSLVMWLRHKASLQQLGPNDGRVIARALFLIEHFNLSTKDDEHPHLAYKRALMGYLRRALRN